MIVTSSAAFFIPEQFDQVHFKGRILNDGDTIEEIIKVGTNEAAADIKNQVEVKAGKYLLGGTGCRRQMPDVDGMTDRREC